MYIIGYFIFGAPLHDDKVIDAFDEAGMYPFGENDTELFAQGINQCYHGGSGAKNGSQTAFFGTSLGRIDENEPVSLGKLEEFQKSLTAEARAEVECQAAALPDEVRRVMPKIDFYIVWASS